MLKRSRFLIVVQAVLALALAVPASALPDPCDPDDPGDVSEPLEACGLTTIEGSAGAVVRLRLPTATTLAASSPEGVEFEGGGALVGAVLMQDRPDRGGLGLLAARFNSPQMAGPWPNIFEGMGGLEPDGGAFALPEGDYLLYLLTDGPAAVTFRFGGLPGSLTFDMERPARFDLRSLISRTPGGSVQRQVQWWGDTGEVVAPRGMLFLAYTSSTSAQVADASGACLYEGQPAAEEFAYAPGCPMVLTPDVYSDVSTNTVPSTTALWKRSEVRVHVDPGSYGVGAWQALGGAATGAEALAFWLSFEP